MTIRVILADPDRSHREVLRRALCEDDDLQIVVSTDDIASTVLQATRVEADAIVITPRFTGSLLVLCSRLRGLEPRPRTLLLDDEGDEDSLLGAIEAGVDGYAAGVPGLADVIRALSRGEWVIPPAMLAPLLRHIIERRRETARVAEQLVHLTRREREVLALLMDGRDHIAISVALFISPETARTHLQKVLRKLGVHSRSEAIALISRTGLGDRIQGMGERSAS